MTSFQDEDYEEWEYDPDYTNWDELNNRFPLIHNVGNIAPYAVISMLMVGIIAAVIATSFGGSSVATDFEATDTNGNNIRLSSEEGNNVVVLDLMATWCKPCKAVADDTLVPLQNDLDGTDRNVVIWSISVGDDSVSELKDYKEASGYNWLHAVNPGAEALVAYSAQNIPKVLVIDMDGNIVYEAQGEVDYNDLKAVVQAAEMGQASTVSVNSAPVLTLAIAAGALSFLAPCAFPLLPGFVTFYVTAQEGREEEERSLIREALPAGIAASSGIFLVYFLLGALLALVGSAAAGFLTLILLPVGLVLITMGIAWAIQYDYSWITEPIISPGRNLWWKIKMALPFGNDTNEEPDTGFIGLFSYGVGYGMSSIGCTVPLLIGLTLAASTEFGTFFGSLAVFVVYALSAATMMICAILLIGASKRALIDFIRNNMINIKRVSGGILVFVGLWVLMWFVEYQFGVKLNPL